jgi:hypothetical protein
MLFKVMELTLLAEEDEEWSRSQTCSAYFQVKNAL